MSDGCTGIRVVALFHSLLVCVALAGCGGPAEDTHESDSGVFDAAEPQPQYSQPLEPGAWDLMSFDERKLYMVEMVLPMARSLFQTFDAERFATVNCKTCHGSGVAAGDFKLPSADLPMLDSAALKNPSAEQQPMV